MIYLDSNVFLNAILDEEKGEIARELLRGVQDGKDQAATSALTFDEVFWVVKKHRGFEDALKASKALLEMPNLIFIEVNDKVIWHAWELSKEYGLDPRDSIHAACALSRDIKTIVSEDDHFDTVKEVKRLGFGK